MPVGADFNGGNRNQSGGFTNTQEIEYPPSDEQLEQPLRVFLTYADKYEDPRTPLRAYTIPNDEALELTQAYYTLRAVLVIRSQSYIQTVNFTMLSPQTHEEKFDSFFYRFLGVKQGLEKLKEENMLAGNKYKEAIAFIEATLYQLIQEKLIIPELFKDAANTIRRLDAESKENKQKLSKSK